MGTAELVPPRRRSRTSAALLLVFVAAACGRDETALQRGDVMWADSDYAGALAEYRLALARRGDESARLRVAHAYARTGQLSRARQTYDPLLQRDSSFADQAVYDYLRLAAEADSAGDRHGVASAIEAALDTEPQLDVSDYAASLARYYAGTGDSERALRFYRRALVDAPSDSLARFLYDVGRIYQAQGDCAAASAYLRPFEQGEPTGADESSGTVSADAGALQADGTVGGEARWLLGSCEFELARRAHMNGQLDDALRQLGTVLRLGVPQNVQDQGWFERAEILFALGRPDEALAAYYRVLELAPTGQLAERAQRRIDQIRFGT